MKKIIGKILLGALVVFSSVGCGRSFETNNVVNITILNSKKEIQSQMRAAVNQFSKENPDIKLKLVTYNESVPYEMKLNYMAQYGNTPTLVILDSNYIKLIEEDILSLEGEKWQEHMNVELSDAVKNGKGELVAFPFAVEGVGLIYNKKVLEEVGVDPAQIKTQAQLETAFKQIEAKGKKALIVDPEDWSLGNHFITTAYSLESEEGEKVMTYFEELKAGKVDLKSDSKVNGLLDTLDLMKQYNMYAESPLLPSYDKCIELLGTGEVGFFYMGNWITSNLLAHDAQGEFGFIPVPISNSEGDYGNSQITASIKYAVIDGANNSIEQQEAAKRFLDWLVFEPSGQQFLVSEAKLIPAFDTNEIPAEDSLTQSIYDYQEAGHVVELMTSELYTDNAETIGKSMLNYLTNEISREQLLTEMANYWHR